MALSAPSISVRNSRPRLLRYVESGLILARDAYVWGKRFMRRVREREELRRMDSRGRQDIGYCRVLDELAKPFWRY